jgi:hypothetical protein
LEQIRAVGRRVYDDSDTVDPLSSYRAKAQPAYFHTVRPVIKDCVPVDDTAFPLIWNRDASDGFCRLQAIDGVGDIEGPSVEYHLFNAGTGVGWHEKEFEQAAQRVHSLERALQVRHWARRREIDEMVLPFFEQLDSVQNPFLEERYGLDREQFKPVLDEFYTLHGWDPQTGWPTRERLAELVMEDVYEPMVEGAARAKERHPTPDYG